MKGMLVDIETEWNLKSGRVGLSIETSTVDIETEWNLKARPQRHSTAAIA